MFLGKVKLESMHEYNIIFKKHFFKKNINICIYIFISLILLDQLTKYYVDRYVNYGSILSLCSILNITLVYNYGAAFSLLANQNGWQIWLFSIISFISSYLFINIIFITNNNYIRYISSIVLSGIIGNMIDRLVNGYVIDFISLHWKDTYFPIFNIADACISIGILLIIILDYFYTKK